MGKAKRASERAPTTLRCGVVAVTYEILSDDRPDRSVSRHSKTNRQATSNPTNSRDLEINPRQMPDGTPRRPLSVEPGRALRDEAVLVETDTYTVPISQSIDPPEGQYKSRPWYRVLDEWRDWYRRYDSSHIEFTKDDETVRTKLENSYQPHYGDRYYAKVKDLERGIERHYDNLTTVMLTLTASHENADGNPRCPADHMRDIQDGWNTARKTLHNVLSDYEWEYARIWEPHKDGYGHQHVAIFIKGGATTKPDDFAPVMRSYVDNCDSAGSDAHSVHGEDAAVSVNDDVDNLGSYITEYIGIYGEETLSRPISEQMFYAVTWATGTRRLDFSNGAQEIISDEQFRRETGLRPEDRGDSKASETDADDACADASDDMGQTPDDDEWECKAICTVKDRQRNYTDPTTGGASRSRIDGRPHLDPEKFVE